MKFFVCPHISALLAEHLSFATERSIIFTMVEKTPGNLSEKSRHFREHEADSC